MSITSRLLAFFGLGKEEAPFTNTVKKEKPAAKAAPVVAAAPPRDQRPQSQPQATPQQTSDDGTNLVMGAVLYSAILSSQDNDSPPSPKEHFQEAHSPELEQNQASPDTGTTGMNDYSPPTDYGGGGGYGGGFDSGSTFAPEFR